MASELTAANLIDKIAAIDTALDALVAAGTTGSEIEVLDVKIKNSTQTKSLLELREHYQMLLQEFPASEMMYLVDDDEVPA